MEKKKGGGNGSVILWTELMLPFGWRKEVTLKSQEVLMANLVYHFRVITHFLHYCCEQRELSMRGVPYIYIEPLICYVLTRKEKLAQECFKPGREGPGGPVVKTLRIQCRRCTLAPWSGDRGSTRPEAQANKTDENHLGEGGQGSVLDKPVRHCTEP